MADSIEECVRRIHQERQELDSVLQSIENLFLTEKALCHDVYRSFFNVIDLADGYWYAVADHHPIQQWEAKLLYVILKYVVMNVWVHHQTHKVVTWMDARRQLAADLMTNSI